MKTQCYTKSTCFTKTNEYLGAMQNDKGRIWKTVNAYSKLEECLILLL